MAPELLKLKQSENEINGRSADIWSLGVTFYAFAYLKVPLDANFS